MAKASCTFLLSLALTCGAQGFDFDAYEATDLSALVARWNAVTATYKPGYSVLTPPRRIRLDVIPVTQPFECSAEPLRLVFQVLSMQDTLKAVSVTQCVRFAPAGSATSFVAYIQDVLVQPYKAEVRIGGSVRLYAFFPAFQVEEDRELNGPLLLVSEFAALE